MSGRLLGAIAMLGIQQMAMAQGADLEGFGVPAQTVITPTRLKQAVQDVPASVTIITGEQMQRLGVRSVPDALQLVAGMQVTQTTGSTYEINYHGGNARNARRLNVLVDGVSVYRPGLAHIDWTALPVDVEDIARIEVVRGPMSVLYGAEALGGVINVITQPLTGDRSAQRAPIRTCRALRVLRSRGPDRPRSCCHGHKKEAKLDEQRSA